MAPRVSQVPVRRQYTELDRWRAYNHYVTTGKFTKKTARECFIAVSTIRSWVAAWDFDAEGHAQNPPQQPTEDELLEIQEVGDIVAEFEELRGMALHRLREVIPKTNSADQLGRIVKDMSERIDRAKGITDGQVPSTVNVNLRLAEAKAAGGELLAFLGNTIASAREREAHIIDAEIVEPPQLEASHSEDGSTDDA
jgi:transposase-like protein